MFDVFLGLCMGILLFVVLFVGIGGTLNIVQEKSCHAQWDDIFETKYSLMTTCMIKVDGRWIPSKNYRVQ